MATANVIMTNTPTAFNAIAFPEQNPVNRLYIENQLNNFSNTLLDAGRQFLETSKDIYQQINDNEVVRSAKAALRMARGVYHSNTIQELYSLEELRSAQLTMQRYIMAEPNIRAAYHKQRCDGYSDTYIDVQPNHIKHDHYDYCRVMDGMVRDVVDDDSEDTWVVNTYAQDAVGNDTDELSFDEKTDIIYTWELAKMFMEANEDPTDIYQ